MAYLNHFEIESKRPGEEWKHVGNIYPDYKWKIHRPWYFLWLVRQPCIINIGSAGIEAVKRLSKVVHGDMPKTKERIRIVVWDRGTLFGLHKVQIAEASR